MMVERSSRTAPRILLTYGRFDQFDQTHIRYLRRIAMLGDELIVGCATDALCTQIGLPCHVPFAERRAMLQSCRYVSRVIEEHDLAQKRTDIVNYNASCLVMGPEHTGQFDDLGDIAQVHYLDRAWQSPAPASLTAGLPEARAG